MKPISSDKTASKVRLRFEPKNQDFILENVGDKESLNIVVEQEGDNPKTTAKVEPYSTSYFSS